MTKPVTAVATMILVDERRLRLDDRLLTFRLGFGIIMEPPAGWDGGYGTSWTSDPKEDLVEILMTQRLGSALLEPASRFPDVDLPGDRRLRRLS